MKKILITNDDGIDSDGLIRLAKVAMEFGEVWVVAPHSQRSAMSHSITLRHSIEAWEVDFPVPGIRAYACDGTPADCVRIGVLNIVPEMLRNCSISSEERLKSVIDNTSSVTFLHRM